MTSTIKAENTVCLINLGSLGILHLHAQPVYFNGWLDLSKTQATLNLSSLHLINVGYASYRLTSGLDLDKENFLCWAWDEESEWERTVMPLDSWLSTIQLTDPKLDAKLAQITHNAFYGESILTKAVAMSFLLKGCPLSENVSRNQPSLTEDRKTTRKKASGYIYLVEIKPGLYKVGFSSNVENRVNAFKITAPASKLLDKIKVSGIKTEKLVHKALRNAYPGERELYETTEPLVMWDLVKKTIKNVDRRQIA